MDGVHGDLDHVVRHVVEEYRIILEFVMILSLHVEGAIVMDLALMCIRINAMTFAVQVRFIDNIYNTAMYVYIQGVCKVFQVLISLLI